MISQQSLGLWGSIGSVLSFSVVALVDPIREAFSIQISPIQYLICLAVFILGLVFGYLLFSKSYKPSIRGLRNTNEDLKRYSIVVVDDIFNRTSTKEFFNDRLSNFNVTFMSKVESARQLTGFDIIVLDIIGVSRYVGGGSAIMKELYQMCPQKYVLAISKSNDELRDIRDFIDEDILKKSSTNVKEVNEALIKSLAEKFTDIFKIMDRPQKFWETYIMRKLKKEPSARVKSVKNTYYHSILGNPSYILKSSKDIDWDE